MLRILRTKAEDLTWEPMAVVFGFLIAIAIIDSIHGTIEADHLCGAIAACTLGLNGILYLGSWIREEYRLTRLPIADAPWLRPQ